MCAATPSVLTVTMPWELPGISLVIGEDEPIVPTPILYPVPIVDEEISHSHPSHRVARVEHIRGSYHEVIDFKLTLEEVEIMASFWDRALEKWYLIFARGRSGWPRGYDIDTLVAQKGLTGLRAIFGNRSHNTVLKRASSIIRFIHWFNKTSFSISPFPLQTYDVEAYLEFLPDQSPSPSALSSFIEAVNFCEKALNIQDVGTAITPKAMNLSELANARRKEKRQARVLSVQEVCSLESFLSNEKNLIVDRFAAGCFLFLLFSRSRWSDLRCVYGYAADILELEGKITGYLEYKTCSHKIARLVLPMAARQGPLQHKLLSNSKIRDSYVTFPASQNRNVPCNPCVLPPTFSHVKTCHRSCQNLNKSSTKIPRLPCQLMLVYSALPSGGMSRVAKEAMIGKLR